MPDITKCLNEDCPIKETCYRWTAIASEWQSCAEFKYDNGCEDYLEIQKNN